ncbi:MAG: DUF4406 domain-containing protein [Puniceicoccales bacterium]|nr:DUF4406 domain-containing protein [Puniceicoccales bacterium]
MKKRTQKPTPLRLYISGPMAGKENNNRESFATVAGRLRAAGHRVFNPAGSLLFESPSWNGWDRDEEWHRRNLAEEGVRTGAGMCRGVRRFSCFSL